MGQKGGRGLGGCSSRSAEPLGTRWQSRRWPSPAHVLLGQLGWHCSGLGLAGASVPLWFSRLAWCGLATAEAGKGRWSWRGSLMYELRATQRRPRR